MAKKGRPAGGNRLINAKNLRASPVRVDSGAKLKKIESPNMGGVYKCSCCGTDYDSQKGNFPASNSILYKGNNGRLTFCRSCVEKYYKQLIDFYCDNEQHALEHCCRLFDWYYADNLFSMTESLGADKPRILVYPSKMNLIRDKENKNSYLDTVRELGGNTIMNANDFNLGAGAAICKNDENGEKEQIKFVSESVVKFFGFGYSNEEYEFLNNEYNDWTSRYECKDKAREEVFKNMCVAQLLIQRVQRVGNVKEVADAMKTFQDLLGTANLKPNQNNKATSLIGEKTYGMFIKELENERPVSAPSEEWADVDAIKKYVRTWYLGHMASLLHVDNDYAKEYLNEVAKYTVTPPAYEVGSDINGTSVLDKYGAKKESE
jgi:hypothetical protein